MVNLSIAYYLGSNEFLFDDLRRDFIAIYLDNYQIPFLIHFPESYDCSCLIGNILKHNQDHITSLNKKQVEQKNQEDKHKTLLDIYDFYWG